MKYYRLCSGLNDKGKLILFNENVYDHIKNLEKDYYQSVYYYTEEQYKQFNKKVTEIDLNGNPFKTIQGCSGIENVKTNKIVFDFDIDKYKRKNISDCKRDAIELCSRLITKGIPKHAIQITFSGNKGFGIIIETEEEFSSKEHKNIAQQLAGDLDTWDTKIYNPSRVIRVSFTKHPISKLYKIPLSLDDLSEMNTPEIKEYAGEFDPKEHFPEIPETWAPIREVPISILNYKKLPEKLKNSYEIVSDDICDLNLTQKPKWLSNWKYALLNGYFPPGSREHALMILGATFKGNGMPKEITYKAIRGAAELQSKRFNQEIFSKREIWDCIIKSVYKSSWKGGTYSEDNFPDELKEYLEELGIPRENEIKEDFFESIDDVYLTFENFAENIEKNTIKTGIKELDDNLRITTNMLVGLLGSPASGKTATVLNILNNVSNNGEKSIFFSLDMGKPLVYQNMARKFTGYDDIKIFEIFKTRDEEQKKRIRYLIDNNYKNVEMCFKTGCTVDNMKTHIINYQNNTGHKVRLVCVDYLEKLVGPFSDATANSGYNAAKLQELANDLECCLIVLLQPQKLAGDPSVPLTSYRKVKGASIIEQDSRIIIGLYREGYSSDTYENDRFITFRVLKNTMGKLCTVDCSWDGSTGSITDLDDSEKKELEILRKRLADEKKGDEL